MKPIKTKKFIEFLKTYDIVFEQEGRGDHELYDKKNPPKLLRPIVIIPQHKEIPYLHIHTNLQTISLSLGIPLNTLKKKLNAF